MTLTAPRLDDRNFQNIVDEAKKRIPHYCKEWTDHNVSDPGVTLIELFAWMTDMILYRLNQVPDLHYIKLMDMLGITLQEPIPARVPVTFWLSKPQLTPVLIPAKTEIASTQTETERPIVFTTDTDFQVTPPILSTVFSRMVSREREKRSYKVHNLRSLEAGIDSFNVFSKTPQEDDALYFGFENDLSRHILGFEMDFDPAGGAGIDPTLPPYIWETSTGESDHPWKKCDLEIDTTKGMNTAGRVYVHLPGMGKYHTNKKELYWVRVRVKKISKAEQLEGMRPYQTTPEMQSLSVASWGGAVPATHAQLISSEFLGQSDGSPGQLCQLKLAPIVCREPDEHLIVQVDGEPPQDWIEVPDFADSDAEDPHFTLDSVTGELRFGPAVRQPDGTIKLYGVVPPRGANLTFTKYRYGGGQVGNVQSHVLNTLKTAIPYISRVSNREIAWGGLDAETLESAKMRVPALLRSRERAVTEDDFEFLARQALPAKIGRVKCLQPRPAESGSVAPGQTYVLVIPRLPQPEGYLDPDQLKLNEDDIVALTTYLDERRLLTVRLDVRPPAYYWVSVKVQLRPNPGVPPAEVQSEVLSRLNRFINPLTGGPDGKGWHFGRDLFVSDVYQSLQSIPNVQFIRNVEMYTTQADGDIHDSPVEYIELVAHGVVASGLHTVEFI